MKHLLKMLIPRILVLAEFEPSDAKREAYLAFLRDLAPQQREPKTGQPPPEEAAVLF